MMNKIKNNTRLLIQLAFTALTNGYVSGFVNGKIFRGKSKTFCVPGLNCYSCPGALGSCPIGSLQAVLGSRDFKFSFYIFGFLLAVGALIGRVVCGFLCPFGLVQDLLYKIPFPVKIKKFPGEKYLRYIKYVLLLVFVILLPLLVVNVIGQGDPWFCKYICPSGTLFAGIPLVASNPGLQSAAGLLFNWKVFLLLFIVILSIITYRPFCRFLCPLGAIYGLLNPFSIYHYEIDRQKCTSCTVCQKKCKLDIPVYEKPNSPECIRCGECKKACPHGAISSSWLHQKKEASAAKTK